MRARGRIFLSTIALAVSGGVAASSPQEDAVAAATAFFEKIDRNALPEAYRQFSKPAQAVVSFEAWKTSLPKSGAVVSRQITKTTVYDTELGKLFAIEFDGRTDGGDRECGYVVVDAQGAIVRLDSTRIPKEAGAEAVSRLTSNLPGCN